MDSNVRRAKTRKGKAVIESRKGKLIENDKNALFVKGSNVRTDIIGLMKETVCTVTLYENSPFNGDMRYASTLKINVPFPLKQLYTVGAEKCCYIHTNDTLKANLKKPNSILLNKKHDWKPFENVVPLELIISKNDCSLFMFGSHTKKRPNNLIIGRTFHRQVLDMMEFEVTNLHSMKEFGESKLVCGSKPILVFSGEQFETEFEYQRMKNLFIDFYSGSKTDGIRLNGLQHIISFVASEGIIYFRCYKILLKKTVSKLPRVDLQEIGPNFELKLRRHKIASESLLKTALKKPKQLKPRKVKNVRKSLLGTTFGRIHMKRQDYGELQTRKLKGLKRSSSSAHSNTEKKRVRFEDQKNND